MGEWMNPRGNKRIKTIRASLRPYGLCYRSVVRKWYTKHGMLKGKNVHVQFSQKSTYYPLDIRLRLKQNGKFFNYLSQTFQDIHGVEWTLLLPE